METRKYRLRTNCLSCGKPVGGGALVVVSELPEDGDAERGFIVHEGCQNAMIRELPWANDVDQNVTTERPRF